MCVLALTGVEEINEGIIEGKKRLDQKFCRGKSCSIMKAKSVPRALVVDPEGSEDRLC